MAIDILMPDIGDFTDIPVVEISAQVGDTVAVDDPILMLRADQYRNSAPQSDWNPRPIEIISSAKAR